MNTEKEIFTSIIETCTEKKIVNLSKKLEKKCSFESGNDAENLCHLAYYLFVYGHEEKALAVCNLTHDIPFPGKRKFGVWNFILNIWGLEVYLLQRRGNVEAAMARIKAIDNIQMQPIGIFAENEEKHRNFENQRRGRFTYPNVLRQKEIEASSNKQIAYEWRFIALFTMLGYGVTGLYPNLVEHWEELKHDIDEYVAILSNSK